MGQYEPPTFILEEELIQYKYNFIQFLSNLSEIIPSQKTANNYLMDVDITNFLWQVKVKKPTILTKIVKIKEVKIISSERLDEFRLNFWEESNL